MPCVIKKIVQTPVTLKFPKLKISKKIKSKDSNHEEEASFLTKVLSL